MKKDKAVNRIVSTCITWACFAPGGWKSISFGVIWKMLTPYSHCNEPMRPRPYIVGALMPLILLGIIPAIICLISGSLSLLVWSIIFIAAASRDIWMAWLLRKERPDSTVLDHPSQARFYLFVVTSINRPEGISFNRKRNN